MGLMIIGASGHGKVIADIAKCCGYPDISFLDDNGSIKKCMGYRVVGRVSDAECYAGSDFIVAIGDPAARERIQEWLISRGMHVAALVHPGAVVAENAEIGSGTVVMAGAVINPDSRVGGGCIINTGATVDHDNFLDDYVHVSIGSHLAGMVRIGKGAWIGAGAVVNNNVNICGGCMVGAGAVVVRDIDEPGTYVGVPARRVVT